MKISVLGNIIETKNIYQITPIKEHGFYIKFLNKKTLHICGYIYDINDVLKIIDKDKLEKLRQEVINYWNKDKSEIPQIEFE